MTRFTRALICHPANIDHYRNFMGTGLLQGTLQLRHAVILSSPRKQWPEDTAQLYARYRLQEHN